MGKKNTGLGGNEDALGMGVQLMCPQGHTLRRIVADAEFACDGCNADIPMNSMFFGCQPCDYSVCNGCYIKLCTSDGNKTEAPADIYAAVEQAIQMGDPTEGEIDPDIQALCDRFEVDRGTCKALNKQMKWRKATFQEDLAALWDQFEQCTKSPIGLLKTIIWEMNAGWYKSDSEAPKELQQLIRKYKLDGDAKKKLTGFINKSPKEVQVERIVEIEKRLATSKNPSATAMTMMVKMYKGEPLPEPFPAKPEPEKKRSRSRHKDRSPVRQRYDSPGRDRRGGDRGGDRDRDRRGDRGGDRGDRGGDRGGDRDRGYDRDRRNDSWKDDKGWKDSKSWKDDGDYSKNDRY